MLMKHYINNECLPMLSLKPKLDLYHQHQSCYKQENYCKLALKRNQRSVLAKLRLGVFLINLELGCYNGTTRDKRWCPVCESKQIENEFHILFHCSIYEKERKTLLDQIEQDNKRFKDLNEIDQFYILTTDFNIIRKTASFLNVVLTKRQEVLRK